VDAGTSRGGTTRQELILALDAGAAAVAGETLSGEVFGPDGRLTVTLLRVEQSQQGTHAFTIASHRTELAGGSARFQIDAPPTLPPAADGDRCRLRYAVRAASTSSRWSRRHTIEPVAMRTHDRPVHEARSRLDRVIPSQSGRHIHLELADALLEGGGHVAGRVHWDGGATDAAYLITVTCDEVWCTNFRFRTRRQPLLWKQLTLWTASDTAPVEQGQQWSPFRFDIPAGMPPATEARMIAWRYTIEARSAERRFPDRAILTPLRFEV
jgi:hypothetical protein